MIVDDTPFYPALPTVAKWRRKPDLTPEQRREYGEAVHRAIRALQRSALMRTIASTGCPCASGTFKSDGREILAHVKASHVAQAEAAANADRRRRTDAEIQIAYRNAMAAKGSWIRT